MYFEHNFMNIDAVLTMPDSNTVQMSREKNMTSDNKISLKVSFTISKNILIIAFRLFLENALYLYIN